MSECRRRERLANEARSSEEKERINRLQGELAEIRRSVSFRLGQLLVAAMQSPGRHAFRLPADLFRLAMDYRRRKGSGVGNDSTVDGPQRRLSGYLRPGIEAHDCLVFPAFEAFTQTRDSELRVACVVSEHLHRCLEPETLLQPLDEAEWDAQLSHFRPNFVLLESAWAFNSKGWVEDFPGGEARSLRALVAECRNRNVPVVFWDTQHNIHRDLFFQVATSCDLVFAMDPLSVERYRQELGDERVALLKLAVQPVLHNPARSHCVGPRQPLVLFDGWADALEWPERFRFLEALAASGLRIVESRYRFVANKLRDLPELETSILGNIEYARLLSARRLSRVCLVTDRTLSSPLANARAAMEAAACGAAVVFVGDDAGFLPEGVARVVATEEEAVAACSELARDGHGAGLASVHARRAIYSAHTYAHRLQEICRKLGLDHRWDEWPLVSAITPTKRPGRLAEAYRRFQMQTYPNKEWIVVVNTTAAGGEDEIERISVDDRVTVLRLHEENNIGRCLNVAIRRSQGAYWFKMDDDDYYGPEYLADMMLELRGVDADVLGKPTAFVYLEAEDLLLRRAGALRAEHIVATADVPHMCGATISGARSVLDTVAFSEDIRASVDTDFVQRCRDAGLAIYLSNIFGFVVLRQADKSQHTWRADDDSLRSNAQPIGDGRVLSDVLG